MKENAHPLYRDVVFRDVSSNFEILTRSTIATKDTIKWKDGNEYPLVNVEISSASHPFFTGQERFIDAEGRVERFLSKFKKTEAAKKKK